MKILVAYSDGDVVKKLAEAIADGAREVKAEVVIASLEKAVPSGEYDFVFLGSKLSRPLDAIVQKFLENLQNKAAAFFFITSKPDKAALEEAVAFATKHGVLLKNTFIASQTGFLSFLGMGSIKEEDLIRARGFGERTLNTVFSLPFGSESEKARIKGYLK